MNNLEKFLDEQIFSPAERNNIIVTDIYVNHNYADFMKRSIGPNNFDCESHWQVLQIGIVGYYRGANIHINNKIHFGLFLCNTENK